MIDFEQNTNPSKADIIKIEIRPTAPAAANQAKPEAKPQGNPPPQPAAQAAQPAQNVGPRLRKVKKHKKKIGDGITVPVTPKVNIEDFDLDNYLDKSKLPSANVKPAVSAPTYIEDDDEAEFEKRPFVFMENDMFSKKAMMIVSLVVFFAGFFFAKLFFTEQTVVSDGLQGVIINNEIPRGRARCGLAERTQGCVLYVMNPQRQDLNARDFYDLASQLTGRQRFVIETGNMRYSNARIRPGEIAQLNIPPLQ